MKYFLFIFICLISSDLSAQYSASDLKKIDSLKIIIKNAKHDTLKNKAYIQWDLLVYLTQPETDKWLNHQIDSICKANFKKTLNESERRSFDKQYTFSLIGNGMIHHTNGEFEKALNNYYSALELNESLGEMNNVAACHNNIGNVYLDQGKYSASLKHHLKALKVREKLKNKSGIATSYNNIALIHENQGNYKLALKNNKEALLIQLEIKEDASAAYSYQNLGVIYKNMNQLDKAIENYQLALALNEKIGDTLSMAAGFGNMGTVYEAKGQLLMIEGKKSEGNEMYERAGINYQKALEISERYDDVSGIAIANLNLGILSMHQKNYTKASGFILRSLEISKEIEFNKILYQAYGQLSKLDSINADFKNAYLHFYEYIKLRDTIFNEENTKRLTEQRFQYEYGKKTTADSVSHAKENEVKQAEIDKQKALARTSDLELQTKQQQQYFLFGGIALLLIFAVVVYNRFKTTQKQKTIIEEQKKDVENKKEMIEEKNKEILDSINYAKRLQEAILPPPKLIDEYLPDNFILYKPKDIVAGDFYWAEKSDDYFFIAAADCTGHGVPGALVSVVCSNALNRSVKEFGITDTGKILDKTTDLVLETFAKSDQDVKDGMDISLLAIAFSASAESESERKIECITWSGANNPLWYVENGEMKEIKADKQPIGKSDNRKPFTTHTLSHSLSALFLFTDGYADQFGGGKGKKFKYKPLMELLCANSTLPMQTQKNELENILEKWKGKLEQNDDICIIGIKL